MTKDTKVFESRFVRNILFIIICITFAIGTWRILTDKSVQAIPKAEKVFHEEQDIQK